ncbi:MAG TPA: cysteine--tRNA ligase [Usitatibacter sp.]|nr:cysteine--tRNA ligase [Usitatibacter sp.]
MSALQIHNTLSRTKEPFRPRTPGRVTMYVCGPTVYDYFHVGNARTFTTFDMVVRWLRASGFEVKYARNITDIDDKIMERARANGEPLEALTQRMVDAFVQDTDRLGLVRPDVEPRATRYVEPMLDMIGVLEKGGHAYRGSNGDVFYAVRSFPSYGKLSRRNLDDLRAGERVAVEAAKNDPLDFVLWKAAKPGEAHWSSPFGEGRPGWHIECSAMACRELGASIDIHGGGWDLQFPHHENEIAQSEGANGKPFAAYWMHGAFLNFASEKMSKSVGNFFTTREVLDSLDRVQGPEQLRYFFLRAHYRSEVEYTQELLHEAGSALRGLYTALREVPPAPVIPAQAGTDWSDPYAARFLDAMNDDFDTPVAFSVLHDLRGEVNRTRSPRHSALLKALGGTIGLLQSDPVQFLQGRMEVDVDALLAERREAKKAKNYARADEIRKEVESLGIVLEDKPNGTTEWRRK